MTKPRLGSTKVCSVCEKEYYVPAYRTLKTKFCSYTCQRYKQYENKRFEFKCAFCKKLIKDSPSRINAKRKYCSRKCLESVTQERRKISRESAAKRRLKIGNISSKALRKLVWDFKEKSCEMCHYKEYDSLLDVHHIDGNPANNFIENLSVLCCMCHRKLHRGLIVDEKFLKERQVMSSNKASRFFKGFADCLKNTANICITGEQVIEIIEMADPNPVDKGIMKSIEVIMKVSSQALLSLSKLCADKATEIDAKDQEELKKLGLLKKDGTVSSIVADVVNQTVIVSPKP